MCGFLVRQQYLLINPAHGPARLRLHETGGGRDGLDPDAYAVAFRAADRQSAGSDASRSARPFRAGASLCDWPRRAELVTATTGALSRNAVNLALDEGWTLQVERKSLCG